MKRISALFLVLLGSISILVSCSDSGNKNNNAGVTLDSSYQMYDNWYKGELHCHSDASDTFGPGAGGGIDSGEADVSTADLVTAYKAKGYDFVFVTEHEVLNTPSAIDGILTINGEEVGAYDGDYYTHGNALNITATIEGDGIYEVDGGGNYTNILSGEVFDSTAYWDAVSAIISGRSRQKAIDNTVAQGGFMQLNHAHHYDATKEFIDGLTNLWGIEIYNDSYNRRRDEPEILATDLWDGQISQGKHIWCTVGDDAHTSDDTGNTYALVNSPEKTEASIIENLKNGNFVACYQKGMDQIAPRLEISLNGSVITVKVTNTYTGDTPTITWYKESLDDVKTTAGYEDSYTVNGNEKFVRFEVSVFEGDTSNEAKSYSQPVFVVK